jgi:secreted Zn-dependent insulinase-like peptidase
MKLIQDEYSPGLALNSYHFQALHAFYKEHYNAKRMRLVVHSTAPLAHIEAQVPPPFHKLVRA